MSICTSGHRRSLCVVKQWLCFVYLYLWSPTLAVCCQTVALFCLSVPLVTDARCVLSNSGYVLSICTSGHRRLLCVVKQWLCFVYLYLWSPTLAVCCQTVAMFCLSVHLVTDARCVLSNSGSVLSICTSGHRRSLCVVKQWLCFVYLYLWSPTLAVCCQTVALFCLSVPLVTDARCVLSNSGSVLSICTSGHRRSLCVVKQWLCFVYLYLWSPTLAECCQTVALFCLSVPLVTDARCVLSNSGSVLSICTSGHRRSLSVVKKWL